MFSLKLFPRFSLGAALMALGLFAQATQQPAQAAHDPTPPGEQSTQAQLQPQRSADAARVQTAAAEWRTATPFPKLNRTAKAKRDANVTIAPRHVPTGDWLLGAYSTETAPKAEAAKTADATYSLADAMRDAIWRKQTAAMLRSLVR